jgi:LPXTG-motif cell wall-anchored protein
VVAVSVGVVVVALAAVGFYIYKKRRK